ncbi:MAG: O-antigen ligase family protein [Planctomycetota bacterium]
MPDEVSKSTLVAQRLLPGAAIAVLLPAMVPWWTVVLPRLDFDVDPRSPGADIVTTLGPAGFGTLAVLGTAAALFALILHGLAGGRFAWKSSLLLLPGLILVGAHLPERFENLWHGTGWAWGVAAGLALLHLGQWPQARRWASAVLAGFAAMLLVEAMNYRFVEHAATVASFEQQREVFLESRGWAVGSSEAQLYERRLRTNDAIGAIGLSNVLATFGAGMATMALGLLIGSLRPRRGATMADVSQAARDTFSGDAAGRWWVGGALFVVAAAIVALTNSTAGVAALGLGCAWVTAVAVLRVIAARRKPGDAHRRALAWCGAFAAVGCVALVYVGVAVRYAVWGVPGPDEVGQGISGELSVLFRAQYWGAAWRMVAEQPWVWLAGVGPGGFGDAYLRFKSPLNPEEVTSAHAFAVDYLATLGVIGGGLWSLVLVGWLARGAWGVMREVDPAAAPQPQALPGLRGAVYGLLGVGGLLVAIEIAVAWAEISGPGAMWGLAWRLAALGAFVLVGGLWWRFADDPGVCVGLVGAAVAVLVHASFDMGLFQPTSAPLVWIVVGLAGGSCIPDAALVAKAHLAAMTEAQRQARQRMWSLRPSWPRSIEDWMLVGWSFMVGIPLGLMTLCLSGTWSAFERLRGYETSLSIAASSLRIDRTEEARIALLEANAATGFDSTSVRWSARLAMETAASLGAGGRQTEARSVLADAVGDVWAAMADVDDASFETRRDALVATPPSEPGLPPGWLDAWPDAGPLTEIGRGWGWQHPGTQRVLAGLFGQWFSLRAPDQVRRADVEARFVEKQARRRAAGRSPTNVSDWVQLADLSSATTEWMQRQERPERFADSIAIGIELARDWYREALRLDDLRYLDPAKQLPESERARVEAWLAEYDASEASSSD